MHRNRLRAGADLQFDTPWLRSSRRNCPEVVVAEQLRPRQVVRKVPGPATKPWESRNRRAPRCRCARARRGRRARAARRPRRRRSGAARRAGGRCRPRVDGTHLGQGAQVVEGAGATEGGLVAHAVIVAGFGVRRFAWDRIRPKLGWPQKIQPIRRMPSICRERSPVHPR